MLRISFATPSMTVALYLFARTSEAQLSQPDGGSIERGSLPAHWLSEQPKCMEICKGWGFNCV
jgi:hydroxyacylglutathione hydrolase